MGEKDIRSIALFFFFALPDEAHAVEAAARALAYARERKKRRPQEHSGTTVVLSTKEVWERFESDGDLPPPSGGSEWVLPAGIDLRSWREFLKTAAPEEAETVIWSAILGLSDDVIAGALGVTPGTVRYRWGRGLSKLGRFVGPRAAVVR